MKQKRKHRSKNPPRIENSLTHVNEVKEEYNKNTSTFFKEVEVLVRRQQRLQAVKSICILTGMGLRDGQEAVDQYIETGNWSHIPRVSLRHTELVEDIFTKVFGTSPKNKIHHPYLKIGETLRFAKKYGEALVLLHKNDIWDYIKNNYYITPKTKQR